MTPEERKARHAAEQRRYRARHPERIREAAAHYRLQHPEKAQPTPEQRRAYRASELGKATRAAERVREREIRKVWLQVYYALRAGRLVRQPCRDCGSEKVHAHHHNGYDAPLDVTWLCALHHAREHIRVRGQG